jgi:molecular chaperone GrpE
MNPEEEITKPEIELEELDIDSVESVDDFIKELEAKERDLHITADLSIEIEEADFDINHLPDFVAEEIKDPATEATPEVIAKSSVKQSPSKSRVYELEQELEKLHARLTELRIERDEIQQNSDRRFKDFQNFKYRVDRERRGSFIDQLANLAMQMLPVLDNLDRALEVVERSTSERAPEFQQFYEGIILVNQQVNEVLAEMGVSPIASVGETFDPAFHEAVAMETSDELAPNTISEEMLRGFRIGNKVIRHSMVKVATSPQSVPTMSHATNDIPTAEIDESEVDLLIDADDTPVSRDASAPEAD